MGEVLLPVVDVFGGEIWIVDDEEVMTSQVHHESGAQQETIATRFVVSVFVFGGFG